MVISQCEFDKVESFSIMDPTCHPSSYIYFGHAIYIQFLVYWLHKTCIMDLTPTFYFVPNQVFKDPQHPMTSTLYDRVF